MSAWPWKQGPRIPEDERTTFGCIEFDDFAGFNDDESVHDKYPAKFEDIYDPRFDDFYQ